MFKEWFTNPLTWTVLGGIAGNLVGAQRLLDIKRERLYLTVGGAALGFSITALLRYRAMKAQEAALALATPKVQQITDKENPPVQGYNIVGASITDRNANQTRYKQTTKTSSKTGSKTKTTQTPNTIYIEQSEPIEPETPDDIVGSSITDNIFDLDDDELEESEED